MGYTVAVRQVLLGLAVGLTAAACSSGDGGTAAPTNPPPTASQSTPPPVQGPPARTVPAGAFIAPADLGPGWRTTAVVATPCAPVLASDATRSAALADPRGTLTETVATGVDVPGAVTTWKQSLQACGYDVRDDPLGDAGITARSKDSADAVVVTGTEGVLIVLHAHGKLAQEHEEMDGWADLALGTSCVAAPDGCH